MAAAFVYVISGDHGRQKIGSSDNPRQRIKDLQTGSPFPLKFEFIGETENQSAGQIEVEAHFTLNQHRAEGRPCCDGSSFHHSRYRSDAFSVPVVKLLMRKVVAITGDALD